MSDAHKREKHWNWQGGINDIRDSIRHCFEYIQWRESVFKRDNFTCRKCGDNKGGNLEADHIKTFSEILKRYNIKTLIDAIKCKKLWEISNGMTLCKDCHRNKAKK